MNYDDFQIIYQLFTACENLSALPKTPEELDNFDPKVLKWKPSFHPWFPLLDDAYQDQK